MICCGTFFILDHSWRTQLHSVVWLRERHYGPALLFPVDCTFKVHIACISALDKEKHFLTEPRRGSIHAGPTREVTWGTS